METILSEAKAGASTRPQSSYLMSLNKKNQEAARASLTPLVLATSLTEKVQNGANQMNEEAKNNDHNDSDT